MKRIRKIEWWERFTKPKQIFLLIFLTIIVIIVILYVISWQNKSHLIHSYWKNSGYYNFNNIYEEVKFDGEKLVHLDLKGAPPKISYYKELFPLLSKLGATGILMEYEDMFPYNGPLLANISALNAYSLDDIRTIIKYAEESHLTIIPLIQTFSHLEFVLKLEDFDELREVPEYPQVICPTHEKTLNLIIEIVDQIIKAHPSVTKLHIGADEVWFLGVCDRCMEIMSKFGWTKNQLFLEHVSAVTHKIHNRYPHLRILMWDDQFRSMSSYELKHSHISTLVEPVVWKYIKNVDEALYHPIWDTYAEVFPKIWIASAFKGASGSNQYLTDIGLHLQNHRSWMNVISEYKHKINFQGIFITGWQRYDHFAVLCELLPVGIPSLAMSLRILQGCNDSPLSHPVELATILQCKQSHGLIGPTLGLFKCDFPGGSVLDVVLEFHALKDDFKYMMEDSMIRGWMSDYNIDHSYSNPKYVKEGTALLSDLRLELFQLESRVFLAMQDVYDNYTIIEWTDTYIKPLASQIRKLWDAREKLLAKTNWPRRPLANSENEL